jgi:deoxycytidylate deaminase
MSNKKPKDNCDQSNEAAAGGLMPDLPVDMTDILYPQNGGELVFAFVSPLGTDEQSVMDEFTTQLKARDYEVHEIKLSRIIEEYAAPEVEIDKSSERLRIQSLQHAGNFLRKSFGGNVLTKLGCAEVAELRASQSDGHPNPRPLRAAYFFRSIKHPDEAALLRTIYGHGFFLVAMHSTFDGRRASLVKRGMDMAEAEDLMQHDEKESPDEGQNTREAFELADFFLDESADVQAQVSRFIDLLFGALYITPTRDEYGMFMAASASQRSGDLSRQVGAAILDQAGDLISAGCNEVPKAGGGSYWPEDEPDVRDFKLGRDPNDAEKEERFQRLQEFLEGKGVKVTSEILKEAWKISGLKDITEFGRTVHAEMDAIMSCSRRGVPLLGTILYATTFPCHNCARHIVAAGVSRVVYVEPYAKSEAYSLYGDSIVCQAHPEPLNDRPRSEGQVPFQPFVGVAPRRFADFFSMRHLTGRRIERKSKDGRILRQNLEDLKRPRLQLSEFSYLDREELAIKSLPKTVLESVQ